ncbi:MAG: hypothetical protein GY757_28645, partial [bacterium]|nr:hypothetical protein [bacterium]
MKENIKQYPVPAVILALLTVTLLIFGIANPGRLMQLTGKLFTAVVAVFDKGYKIEIAYPIAIMVMVGLLILLVKNLLSRTKIHQTPAPLWETVRDGVQSYKDHKRNKTISRAVAVLAVIVSVLLIKTVNFPFAFLFTGVVVIYYQLKNRTQPVVSLLLVLMVLLLFLAPYVFQGQGIHMKISDVMDAWVPQQKVLAESGSAFSLNPKTEIANFINGIRISGFVNSGYNVITILFMIFPPFTA